MSSCSRAGIIDPGPSGSLLRVSYHKPAVAGQQFDTVICLNVLEHVDDDRSALAAIRRLLAPAGRLVLLVPALPALYGTIDRALGHHRRYTRTGLAGLLQATGYTLTHIEYFNLAGVPGGGGVSDRVAGVVDVGEPSCDGQ